MKSREINSILSNTLVKQFCDYTFFYYVQLRMLRKVREEISCKKFALYNIMSISDYACIRLGISNETEI